MKHLLYFVMLLIFSVYSYSETKVNIKVDTLCQPNESIVFNGIVEENNKIVSVCKNNNNLQYRYGRKDNIEIVLPKNINQQHLIKTASRGNNSVAYSFKYLRFINNNNNNNNNYNYLLLYGYGEDRIPFASIEVYKEKGNIGIGSSTFITSFVIKSNYYLIEDLINVKSDQDDEHYSWF